MPLLPERSSLLPCALINIGIGARLWGGFLKILRKNYADIIGDFEHSAFQVGCSKSRKIKACKEAAAPSQRRFALARIIVCCGASIVAHFARKVRATNT